jgi:glycopeptide antibiotics resistance protein
MQKTLGSGIKPSKRRIWVHAVVVFLTSILIIPFVLPFWIIGAGWWDEVADLAHFLSFGFIAVLGNFALRFFEPRVVVRLVFSLLFVALLAISTEAVQFYLHENRSGNWTDVIRNCLGAICLLSLVVATNGTFHKIWRIAATVIFLCLIIWAMTPISSQQILNIQREKQLPVLFNFDEAWEHKQLSTTHVTRRSAISSELGDDGYVETFDFLYDHWGRVRFERVWPNWQDYSTLIVDVFADTQHIDVPITVHFIFVTDIWQLQASWATANVTIKHGRQQLVIPFDEIVFDGQKVDFVNAKVQFIDFTKSGYYRALTLSFKSIELM